MALPLEQAELLARVAHLYFEKGQDQSAIARRLRVSRSSVSRLLAQARRQGIVEIRVNYPLPQAEDLAANLRERFALRDARVVKTSPHEGYDAKTQVARLAARYLEENIAPGSVLAISRGSTLHAVVENVRPALRRGVRVVQLVGRLRAASSLDDGGNLVQALARKFDADFYNLNAPLFVENVHTRLALLEEPAIRDVLQLAEAASLALVGIGALDRNASSIVREKLLSASQVQILRRGKAVGEICSQYYDIDGRLVSTDLSVRTIGLELERLKKIPWVVGVAAGRHKVRAIRGALRGGYVNVIIVDDLTASLVLDLDRELIRKAERQALLAQRLTGVALPN